MMHYSRHSVAAAPQFAFGRQGVTTLGTIYSSSLFPGRCHGGEMLLLNYIGGATNRGVKEATTEQLAEQVGAYFGALALGSAARRTKSSHSHSNSYSSL